MPSIGCHDSSSSLPGAAWGGIISTLGRKVLAAIPEDTHPSKKYEVPPVKVGAFKDVNANAWYAQAVKWALDKNVISDASPELFPDKTCTKGDFYTFLWNAAGRPQSSGANPFSDVKATDAYYGAAIWAKEKGMVSGNTFAPMTNLTRKECVIGLWKYMGSPDGFYATQYLEVEKLESDFGRSIGWSHMNGVMGGTDLHKFSPQTSSTRAQTINYIYRALK